MTKASIHLDGIIVQVIRKPIKHLILRVYPPDGEVKLSTPHAISLPEIEQHLWSKHAWIQRQRQRLLTRQLLLPAENPDCLVVWGQPHPLQQQFTSQRELHAWYRQQLQAVLPDLIVHWQAIIGVAVESWGIKAMKTRWGSCNPRAKRIWLNLYLIHKPKACLEYVLVHEMVHLLEASHNRRFYALMDHFLPKWRTCQSYLK